MEDKLMSDITIEYNKARPNQNKPVLTPLDKLMADIDNYPLNNKMTHLIDPTKNSKWRMNYYHYLFGDHTESLVKSASLRYLEGITWNVNYYLNRNYSTSWLYPYNYAPCLTDLNKYLSIMGSQNFIELQSQTMRGRTDEDIPPEMQLLLVLPPQSVSILPPYLRPLMTDIKYSCLHYYPIGFKMSTYLKYFGWEVLPILPDIDVTHLKSVYDKQCTTNIPARSAN
jgi:5'-3' exonuclease